MAKYRLVNTLNLGDVLVQTLIWVALVVITFGLEAFALLRLLLPAAHH